MALDTRRTDDATTRMTTFLDKLIERFARLDPERQERFLTSLARERGFLQSVFDTIEDAVLVLNPERRIAFINRAAKQLLGVTGADPINRPLLKYLSDGKLLDLIEGESPPDTPDRTPPFRTELEVHHPRSMVLRVSVLPLRRGESQTELGTVVILHDTTAERRQQRAAFQSEKLSALATLAAGMAHEIGNPLNSLGIHLQLLARDVRQLKPGRRRDALVGRTETCLQEIERLDGIIRQFLGAIRPSKLNATPVQINDLIDNLLEFAYYEITGQDIGIEKHYAPAIPRSLMDEAQIKQAFLNIIKNALQAMPGGGLLTVTTKLKGDEITITFADTGVGIPPEQLSRIFDPFFTTKDRGSGLGLMIVHKIIADHDGRIDVDSRPGKGTRIRLTLPVRESHRRLLEHGPKKRRVFGTTPDETNTPSPC